MLTRKSRKPEQLLSLHNPDLHLSNGIDFVRSSDMRLPRMVAEIDMTATLIKRLGPSLANFLERSIY